MIFVSHLEWSCSVHEMYTTEIKHTQLMSRIQKKKNICKKKKFIIDFVDLS